MLGTQDFLDDMRLVPASTPEVGIIPTERERALQFATEALAVVVPEERTFDNLLDLAEFLLEEEPEEEVVALNTLQGTVRTVINQHINNPPATTPEETVARIDSELLSQHMSELHDRVGEEVLGDEPADEPETNHDHLVFVSNADEPDDFPAEVVQALAYDESCLAYDPEHAWHLIQLDPADFHPAQLDTLEEYEAAPVGTRISGSNPAGAGWQKYDGGWGGFGEGDGGIHLQPSELLANGYEPLGLEGASRKVLRWGAAA